MSARFVFLLLLAGFSDDPAPVVVRDAASLRAAVSAARPGSRILVAPGAYEGGFHFANLRGTAAQPIVIAAEDRARPPLFRGGAVGLHLSSAAHVELADLTFEAQTGNGINLDDGGSADTPAHHLVLRGLAIRDVGPAGNCDGIKLSGALDFRIEGCTVERWGGGGSALDMVGCRRGTIERCTFRGDETRPSANGVQAKGGTQEVAIRRCRFEHAGSRAVNLGGSTGLEHFRPPLASWTGPRFEAREVAVEGCTFHGSDAAVAFVGADACSARFNTIHLPARWALRILQENRAEGFVPSRTGRFSDNLVVFRSARWSEGGVNVGPATEPATFRFERNVWFCADAPARTRELVRLPSEELRGSYGIDPGFLDAERGDLRLREGSPAAAAGAGAFVE